MNVLAQNGVLDNSFVGKGGKRGCEVKGREGDEFELFENRINKTDDAI